MNSKQMIGAITICALQVLIVNWFNAKGFNVIGTRGLTAATTLFLEAIPGTLILVAIVAGGVLIHRLLPWKAIPAVGYIVTLGCIVTIPGVPGAEMINHWVDKVSFIGLCTPVLAYSGIAVGKDLGVFKKLAYRRRGTLCFDRHLYRIGSYCRNCLTSNKRLNPNRVKIRGAFLAPRCLSSRFLSSF